MTASSDFGNPTTPATPASEAPRRLVRSRANRTFAGVCGGLAEYYGSDVTAVRLLTVVIMLVTGIFPVLILYLIAAIVIPERMEGDPAASAATGGVTLAPGQGRLILGIVLVAVGILGLADRLFWIEWEMLWPVALIVLGGVIVLASYRR